MGATESVNLTRPSEVKALCQSLGFSPSRVLGQNFLVDGNILDILLSEGELCLSDGVLEVGPGLGVVTDRLAQVAGRVVAIEKDRRLGARPAGIYEGHDRVELMLEDALDVDLAGLFAGESGLNKMVANLPYSVGSRILMELAQAPEPPERMVVTVQYEVAQRLVATPETGHNGLLSIWTQLEYQNRIAKPVGRNCFWPRPEIRSAIVTMKHAPVTGDAAVKRAVREATRVAYQGRRKQLCRTLERTATFAGIGAARLRELLVEVGAATTARPEELTAQQWCELVLVAGVTTS
jgi:16S rRNA (adenine1518-N6/adenine1519-N6)-dimethyltransferase